MGKHIMVDSDWLDALEMVEIAAREVYANALDEGFVFHDSDSEDDEEVENQQDDIQELAEALRQVDKVRKNKPKAGATIIR